MTTMFFASRIVSSSSAVQSARSAQRALLGRQSNGILRGLGRRSRILAPHMLRGNQQSLLWYSTERAVELRRQDGRPTTTTSVPKALYAPDKETENCGVGLIASLKSVPSRDIVEKADEMLVRMSHRGGCGCDPASGDGSGTYLLFEVETGNCWE